MVHIGIIPDGNRRWCKKNNIDLVNLIDHWINGMLLEFIKEIIKETNTFNSEKKQRMSQNLKDLKFKDILFESEKIINLKNEYKPLSDITEISLYVSSIDNLSRNDQSVEIGYQFIKRFDYIVNNIKQITKFNIDPIKLKLLLSKIKLNIIGDIDKIPDDILAILQKYNNSTINQYVINIAIAYDYHKDIKQKENYIRNQSEIDIVFRSGGEMRLSGFFPTKVLYSELYFCKKLWPDIKLDDIRECLNEFYKRNRRFGK
jgi:undecaprenyl pyrophosphate synthase